MWRDCIFEVASYLDWVGRWINIRTIVCGFKSIAVKPRFPCQTFIDFSLIRFDISLSSIYIIDKVRVQTCFLIEDENNSTNIWVINRGITVCLWLLLEQNLLTG